MFDSKITLRALANTAAVRFASAAERCYRQERAGRATFNDFVDGCNESNENPDGMDGKVEMSLHERTQVLGAIWQTLYSQCTEASETKYDLPMTLEDAYSLVVYGQVVERDARKRMATQCLNALVAKAVKDAQENAQLLVDEGEITAEEAAAVPDIASKEAIAEFTMRLEDFDAVLGYMQSIPTDFGYQDGAHLNELLNRFEVEEKQNWLERAHEKLLEAKEKLIARILSSKTPAKAKADLRAELPLLKADIQFLAQELRIN